MSFFFFFGEGNIKFLVFNSRLMPRLFVSSFVYLFIYLAGRCRTSKEIRMSILHLLIPQK